jgi:hypothetical protein
LLRECLQIREPFGRGAMAQADIDTRIAMSNDIAKPYGSFHAFGRLFIDHLVLF